MSSAPALPSPPSRPSAWEAFQSTTLEKAFVERFARVPSQRKALIFGIAGGTFIGGLRFLTTKRGWSSVNWGVYSFVFLSSISYYNLSMKRQTEVDQIHQVITKMNQVKPSAKLTANLADEGQRQEDQAIENKSQINRKWWHWQ
ncbi:hypothetical protein O181_024361 [Austropuccinia psidii MF-1]|uniref:Cytochrome c oxidase assembly protein COX20, mitochondrial n=1 Tax=Austropuccinia psidii MF-1 TaxID=1389203 RepID=A0A9Q3GYJ8_9BASI|nr:hypothetical protein [Austropuccinia psidii MF-1]